MQRASFAHFLVVPPIMPTFFHITFGNKQFLPKVLVAEVGNAMREGQNKTRESISQLNYFTTKILKCEDQFCSVCNKMMILKNRSFTFLHIW